MTRSSHSCPQVSPPHALSISFVPTAPPPRRPQARPWVMQGIPVSPCLPLAPLIQTPTASPCPGDKTPNPPRGPPVPQARPHPQHPLCRPCPGPEASWMTRACSHGRPPHRPVHVLFPTSGMPFLLPSILLAPTPPLASQVPSGSVSGPLPPLLSPQQSQDLRGQL